MREPKPVLRMAETPRGAGVDGVESSVGWAKSPSDVPIIGSQTGSQSSVGWASLRVPIIDSQTGSRTGPQTGPQVGSQTTSEMGTAQGAFAHPTELTPDWVCEVLSPATARTDRVLKMPLYAAFGVGHLWLIDPGLQTLEVFESQEGKWFLWGTFQENDTVSAPPFDALHFNLGRLWP